LAFADASLDRVLSSLVLHHLTHNEKLAAFREARRVLPHAGSLHVLDFGPVRGWLERVLTHLMHHGERMEANLAGRLPARMLEASFVEARKSGSVRTAIGRRSSTPCRRRLARSTKGRRPNCPTALRNLGARDRVRTGDIHVGNVVLYQLSYSREGEAI
jgi:SAM-dependent methyltransferase